jgi:transposase-like protein
MKDNLLRFLYYFPKLYKIKNILLNNKNIFKNIKWLIYLCENYAVDMDVLINVLLELNMSRHINNVSIDKLAEWTTILSEIMRINSRDICIFFKILFSRHMKESKWDINIELEKIFLNWNLENYYENYKMAQNLVGIRKSSMFICLINNFDLVRKNIT